MQKTIVLAANLYEHNQETHMTFYCKVPDVKEGFMALNIGEIRADYGFWSGLHQVVALLHRTYKGYGIQLAVYQACLSLMSRQTDKEKVFRLLESFAAFEQIPSEPYIERLDIVHDLAIIDQIKPGELKGYSLEAIASAQMRPPVVKKDKPKRFDYYNDFPMPSEGVVLDFETTSPIVEYAKVIEISALKFCDGKIVDSFQTLCNPRNKIPKQARELTGITDKDVEGMPSSFQAMKKLNQFLTGSPVVVGHNVQYDYRVLKAVCDKAGMRVWTGKLLCTMRQAKQLKLAIDNYDLSTLCSVFGIINERPHRAWSDTAATFEVMKRSYQSLLV